MAFDLGSIRARMGLDPGGFVSGLRSAETAAEIFGPKIVDLVNNPLLGTIRIVKEAGTAFAGLVVDVAQQNKALDDWARRLGISTEVLSALSAEARRLGIETEDVADTIGELAVKARDGVEGSEDLLKTFERLGVSVTDRHGELRDLESLLIDTARGLANVTNETERYAIADELASDGAKRLLPVLIQLGERGYDPLIRQARNYGQLLEGDAARASRTMADRVGDLSLAFDGMKRTGATAFIQGFSQSLDESDASVQTLAAQINRTLNPALREAGGLLGDIASSEWARDTLAGIQAVLEAIRETNDELDELKAKTVELEGPGENNRYETESFWRYPISVGGYNFYKFRYWLLGYYNDSGDVSRDEALERARELQRQLQEQNQRRLDRASGG